MAEGVRIRHESFGAIAYVPRRDHFFALDEGHAALVSRMNHHPRPVDATDRDRIINLAELGVCVTEPATAQRAFYGRSQVGVFDDLPTSDRPFVVNCFTTAHCPLRCVYCHADDLMVNYRDGESDGWLDQVIRVAAATPALVGVVTGGEPLNRPDRATRLIRALAHDKAVVLDTSGVGDFARLVPHLRRYGVHVRVSLDSADPRVNDRLRPIGRHQLPLGASAHAGAVDTLRRAVDANLPCSVQTVVTARNGDLNSLLRMRDLLTDLRIGTWVLHVVVPAGKAGGTNRTSLLCPAETVQLLGQLVRQSAHDSSPIDIRVTSTHGAPNSVMLISAKGELCVESPDGSGKRVIPLPATVTSSDVLHHFHRYVSLVGHASRYLNGALNLYQEPIGAILPGY